MDWYACGTHIFTCTMYGISYFMKLIVGFALNVIAAFLLFVLSVSGNLFDTSIVQVGFSVCLAFANLGFGFRPPGWIGRMVRVQWDGVHVRLLDPRTGQLLREHLRQARDRRRIKDEDRPKRTPPGTVQLLERAARSGPNIGQLSKALYERQAEAAVRRILGILTFTKKYGVARVDDACAAALEMQAYDYRFVRVYLERRFGAADQPAAGRPLNPPTHSLPRPYRRTNTAG